MNLKLGRNKKYWLIAGVAIFLVVFFFVKVSDNKTRTLYDVMVWNWKTKSTDSYVKEGTSY